MIYITQLIYIREGQEEAFNEFESIAIPLIAKYGGKLLLRIRPGEKALIEASAEPPYELHLVSFEAEEDLEEFMQDDERKKFLHLKEQAIRTATLIKGVEI